MKAQENSSMQKDIVFLDLFSGIGGFSKGFEEAGFRIKKHYFSEVDKYAIANYQFNFKHAIHVGSITDVRGSELERPNVIAFGSPCQDFSMAGKRSGMEGQRSSLITEAIRLVSECRPDVFVWENVKGAFSSNNSEDFWGIIQAFANIGGYRLEWQLLNTKWLLPQNRERIYLVGHLDGASRPCVFPFTENDSTFTKQAVAKGTQPKAKLSTSISTKNGYRTTDTYIIAPEVAGTLTAGGNSGGLHSDMTTLQIGTLRTHKDGGFREIKSGNAPTLPARAREDGSGQPIIRAFLTPNRIEKSQNGRRAKEEGEASFTLNCQDQHGIMLDDQIRRLTEIECERLQGYEDNWTQFGLRNGVVLPIPKTQRYKLLGNTITKTWAKLIAERILNQAK